METIYFYLLNGDFYAEWNRYQIKIINKTV